jgi:hypothetical protein
VFPDGGGAETATLNYGIFLAEHLRVKPIGRQRWLPIDIALQRSRFAQPPASRVITFSV